MKFVDAGLALLLLTLLAVPFVSAQDQGDETMPPQIIEINRPGFMPEGIEWDAERGRFLLGSMTEGTIFAVTDNGEITPFIEDDDLVSTFGIHIDEVTERLLVTNANRAVLGGMIDASLSQLAAYDLETGERLFLADFRDLSTSPVMMANDVTVDDQGNAYVTDSFASVVFKVTPEGEASVFATDPRFPIPNNISLNGIDYHPDGYLLVANPLQTALYKIPLDDPTAITQVELEQPFGADGLVLQGDTLTAVAFAINPEPLEIYSSAIQVESDDGWETARITQRAPLDCMATTIALRDSVPYYINAYQPVPDREIYEIVQPAMEEFSGTYADLLNGTRCTHLEAAQPQNSDE